MNSRELRLLEPRPNLRGVVAHRGQHAPYITSAVTRVHDALTSEYEANGGWPIRVRRIAEVAGFKTTSVVHEYLQRLAEQGLAERGPSVKDGWRPTGVEA